MFSIGIFLSYSVHGYVAIDVIWAGYLQPQQADNMEEESFSLEYLVRMALVLASVLCSIAFPNFELLLAFVGSLFLSQLILTFPAIINICICHSEGYGPYNYKLWRSIFLILLGLLCSIFGSMTSLFDWLDMAT